MWKEEVEIIIIITEEILVIRFFIFILDMFLFATYGSSPSYILKDVMLGRIFFVCHLNVIKNIYFIRFKECPVGTYIPPTLQYEGLYLDIFYMF